MKGNKGKNNEPPRRGSSSSSPKDRGENIGLFVEQSPPPPPASSASSSTTTSTTTCCIIEDCESTVTLRVRCRRGHLLAVLPVLALLSLSANLNLMYWHQRQQQQQQIEGGGGGGLSASSIGAAGAGGSGSALQSYFAGSNTIDEKKRGRAAQGALPPNPLTGTRGKGAVASAAAAAKSGTNVQVQQQRRVVRAVRTGKVVKVARKKKNPGTATAAAAPEAPKAPKIEPRPTSVQPNATFSACLLIKDDNEILPEWLAYHYHVLNLRSLIVAVDPLSVQSPSSILSRWRLVTDLHVLEWSDDNYMPADFLDNDVPPEEYMQKREDFDHSRNITDAALLEISNHRYRQRVFLAECMKRHRKMGNSWVVHIDTDEYVVASKLLRQMKPDYLTIPPMDEPGSVLSLIQQAVAKTSSLVSYPCISMLRVLFGSVESAPRYRDADVPPGFNSTSFETLRWRYHALPHNMTIHGNPKVILDVAAIPQKYLPDVAYSIHRPVPEYCHKNKDLTFTSFRKQPIAVNHYLGSWERYSGRQDRRRSRAVYDAKANQRRGRDDGVRPWLRGFVRAIGHDTAAKLLGGDYLAASSSFNEAASAGETSSAAALTSS